MPSLNLDLNYFDNIKTMRLVARLGPGSDVLPIKVWVYAGKLSPESGRLALLESELEHICGWWGKKGEMLAAMVEIGFLKREGNLLEINDWFEHSGHLAAFKKRAKKAAKKRWGVKLKISNASSNAKGEVKQSPCSAVHNMHSSTCNGAFRFECIYSWYPNKDSRKEAERHFKATVKTAVDFQNIKKALATYLDHLREETWKKPQSAKTWFNNWQNWVNYKAERISQIPQPYQEKKPDDKEIPTAAEVKEFIAAIPRKDIPK